MIRDLLQSLLFDFPDILEVDIAFLLAEIIMLCISIGCAGKSTVQLPPTGSVQP